ncbi:MAG: cation-transporting P-type ATPase, partial [bacterium]|nr:cation-transporting P-type ATPase [bacterium]
MQHRWHNLTAEEVLEELKTSRNGLNEAEVKERLKHYGPNKLADEKSVPLWLIFLKQFQSPLIYILVLAGGLTLFLRDFTDSIVIFGAVFLN